MKKTLLFTFIVVSAAASGQHDKNEIKGTIGINTTHPQATLDINGTLRVRSVDSVDDIDDVAVIDSNGKLWRLPIKKLGPTSQRAGTPESITRSNCQEDDLRGDEIGNSVPKENDKICWGGLHYEVVKVTHKTGKTKETKLWLDRNLGAIKVADSAKDEHAYGHLYQWGRSDDGHQYKNSEIYSIGTADTTTANTEQPWFGKFITTTRAWSSLRNSILWKEPKYENNPCPPGFKVPTRQEWEGFLSFFEGNPDIKFSTSPLKAPMPPIRETRNGRIANNAYPHYWTSTTDRLNDKSYSSSALEISDDYIGKGYIKSYTFKEIPQSYGVTVRCIQK